MQGEAKKEGGEAPKDQGRGRSVGGFGHLFDMQGANYDRFRPDYPQELYDHIFNFAGFAPHERRLAVDLGCGTGQATKVLAQYFARVKGVDPSSKMIDNAQKADNIEYELGTSEQIRVPDASVDLLTTAQAAHWFKLEPFYTELKRILRPGGVVAIWGYGLCKLPTTEASEILYKYHTETLGESWEPERKLLDAGYVHIDLPFERKERIQISIKKASSFNDFVGYLNTGSGLKTYRETHPGAPDPLLLLADQLYASLNLTSGEDEIEVTYPTVLLLGQKPKA